jgi:hypothetical protein
MQVRSLQGQRITAELNTAAAVVGVGRSRQQQHCLSSPHHLNVLLALSIEH